MAIIPGVPGVSVEVQVADQRAVEYEDPQTETLPLARESSHTCYIMSRSGENFSVNCQVTGDYQARGDETTLVCYVYVDGSYIDGGFCAIPAPGEAPTTVKIAAVEILCPTTEQLRKHGLVFAHVESVEVDDNDRVAADEKKAKHLGLIEVDILTGRRGDVIPKKYTTREVNPNFSLAEKAMKGRSLSHGTSFSEGKAIARGTARKVENGVRLCRFYFKYRSLKALREELVLPTELEQAGPVDESVNGSSSVENVPGFDNPLKMKREMDNDTVDLTSDDVPLNKKARRESTIETVDLTQD